MPPKDLRNALKSQRSSAPKPAEPETIRPFGDRFREELELEAGNLPIQTVSITQLRDNPYQSLARSADDASVGDEKLDELAESIRSNGFYGALLARQQGTSYQLAYGHRRREAARRAGITELPVKLMDLSDEQMARIMASENFSREDLSPTGEANVVGRLYSEFNMSAKDIAAVTGKGRGWVQNRLELFNAPNYVKQMVQTRPESFSLVPVLMTVEDPEARQVLSQEVVEKNLTRDQLRDLVATKANPGIVKKPTKSTQRVNSEKSNDVTTGDLTLELGQLAQLIGQIEEKVKRRKRALNAQETSLLVDMSARLRRLK